ncbi:Beta-barrel assembly machine subunit BamB [Pseudidiomarina planktonica]|uniref:Outer membrane protein assembly factor BamB n=1 Tax=Pseudidiomarina planktonica TaxID=1323738 RepID=A0A1Y6EFZ8_9GAMM|nr:outer membrane protein assembly factor BamB [Pseudidiomarina planktonica]RUO65957.1 outer membrane protein assembly factor BamB [Pseudidiomarina planktonica]SMQ61515.1 Beta-barrel assembly machine subunit BamB [Pseudidiomarina planktonica]
MTFIGQHLQQQPNNSASGITPLLTRIGKALAVGTAAVSLSACSIFSTDEITWAELQPIDEQIKPSVEWDESVGDGVEHYFSRLGPVVVGDHIIAADREGVIKSMHVDTGKTKWRMNLTSENSGWKVPGKADTARISGGLVANSGNLYFGTENGEVGALNATTGELLWQQKVAGEVLADPAVGEGMVVVHTSSGSLVGLNADTGKQRWEIQMEVPTLTLRGSSAPSIASGGAVFGTNSGKLTVAILENGQRAWETPIAKPRGSTELERLVDVDTKPIIFGGTIYTIAFNGQLSAVELSNGRIIWQRKYSSYQSLAVTALAIYVTDDQSHVHAIERSSGTEIWSSSELYGRQLTAPTVSGEFVVVGDFEGYFHWLNRSSGEIQGRLELDGDGAYVPALEHNNMLYMQLRDGSLVKVKP